MTNPAKSQTYRLAPEPPPAVYTYDPPSTMTGRRYDMKANSEIAFEGGVFPRHRRQFIITNLGALFPNTGTLNVHLRNQDTGLFTTGTEPPDGLCIFVKGGTTITIFTNAKVIIRNPNDANQVSVTICEIFYAAAA